jgi:hypothetical protein
MPWEILRSTKLTPDRRVIDIITKGGSLKGYYSSILMIPEFGIGVTILVAGDYAALADLREKIIATLIPLLEKLVRDEVRKQYSGTWAHFPDWWNSNPDANFSLKLEVDNTGPGLRVMDWLSNGTDFLPVYERLKGISEDQKWQARLIPTGVIQEPEDDDNDDEDTGWSAESWRLTVVPERRVGDEKKVFDDFCMTDVDSLMYSGVSIEEFVILKMEGDAQWIFLLGMGTDMFKCDERDACSRSAGKRTKFQGAERKFGMRNTGQVPLIFG